MMNNYEDVQELLQKKNVSVLVNYRPGTALVGTLKQFAKTQLKSEFHNIMIEDPSILNPEKLSDKELSGIDSQAVNQVKALKSGTDYLIVMQGLEYLTEDGQKQFLKEINRLKKEASVQVVYAISNPGNIAEVFFDKCKNCYHGPDEIVKKDTLSVSNMNHYPDELKAKFVQAIAKIRDDNHSMDNDAESSNKLR